jgi:hypothetical protein
LLPCPAALFPRRKVGSDSIELGSELGAELFLAEPALREQAGTRRYETFRCSLSVKHRVAAESGDPRRGFHPL